VIVLDSSILVGIIKGEPDCEPLIDLLDTGVSTIGAPTLVETRAWCAMNMPTSVSRWLETFVDGEGVSVVPFSRGMADVASQAFITFGRASQHPARLNFGDCMAYAVSTVMRAPLLFKGGDFGRTDVMMHPASIRG
jgi:ribonuclease VapC